MKINLAKQCKC